MRSRHGYLWILLMLAVLFAVFIYRYPFHAYPILYFRVPNAVLLQHGHDTAFASVSIPLYQAFQVIFDRTRSTQLAPSFDKAHLLFFETFNTVDFMLDYMRANRVWPSSVRYVYGIKGTDDMVSKSRFAYHVLQGKQGNHMIPETYILALPEEKKRFEKVLQADRGGTMYILKRNIQRQQGYELISSREEFAEKERQHRDFVVAQRVLTDPFLVSGHKINMRIYLLVRVCKARVRWWIYNDGFLYYAPEKFDKRDMKPENLITSGYIDRKIYRENPMTIKGLTIQKPQETEQLLQNTRGLFRDLYDIYALHLSQEARGLPGTQFCLFGCDIAPCEDLTVRIMEINKGPDLSFKDEKDGNLKLNMVHDMLCQVGICVKNKDKSNGFLEI